MPPSIKKLGLIYNPVRHGLVLRRAAGVPEAASDPLPLATALLPLELDMESGAWLRVGRAEQEGWCHLREVIPQGGARLPWFVKAHAEIGVSEAENAEVIREKYVYTTIMADHDDPDWCACFVSWCMKDLDPPQVDLNHGNSQHWAEWEIERIAPPGGNIIDAAKVGDLVVGQRTPTRGHVAFFLGASEGHVLALGGNQSMSPLIPDLPKSVRYSWYPIEHELGRVRTVRHSHDFP